MTLEQTTLSQYQAATKRGAFVDLSQRGKIKVTGKDRAAFLHRMLTNDIQTLSPGFGCYACLLTAQAKIISDMNVLVFDDFILLDLEENFESKLIQALEKFIIADDVELKNMTRDFFEIEVRGPQGKDLIRKLSTNVPKPPFTHFEINIKGAEQGKRFRILGKASDREKVVSLLTSAGEKLGIVWIDPEVDEILRVESGIPKCGVDFSEETLLLETNLADRAVSFTKGCYPGQEIVARMDSRGKSAKKLVGLQILNEQIPKSCDVIQKNGKPIGKITSAVYSPKFSSPLALGYIASDLLTSKGEFEIVSSDKKISVRLADL